MKILCLTPISHIKGLRKLLDQKGIVFYLENINQYQAKVAISRLRPDALFINPNMQSYILGKNILYDSTVKLINTCSTGTNHIDIDYCKNNDIEIWSLKNDMKLLNQLPSTSELAFGLLLDLARNISKSQNDIQKGQWDYTKWIGHQLKGLRIGIVGYGRLGSMMANYCRAFDMRVTFYDPNILTNVKIETLEELFKINDIISLHPHVTDDNKHFINANMLSINKDLLYLINTARGELVVEKDIIKALEQGWLQGYGTDVLEDEYTEGESTLIKRSNDLNIIVTPHVGGMTWEGQERAFKWAINKFKDE